MAGPRQLVDAPAFTLSPYGLLSASHSIESTNPHWQNGITYPTSCNNTGGTTYDECIVVTGSGLIPQPSTKSENTSHQWRGATPFTVYTKFDCSPVGVDHSIIAKNALFQTEEWQVERAFWTGLVNDKSLVFPHLAATAELLDPQDSSIVLQTAATIPVTGAFDVVCGLGIIEQELANCYKGKGVIHIPRKVLPALRDLVIIDNGVLKTHNGNLVVAGSGYPGTGPAGETTTSCQSWVFATGQLMHYRSNVRINRLDESIDRSENTVQMIAERTYVLGWDCCHLAILVDLNEPV